MLLGIDMGGTHIDGVLLDEGKLIRSVKNEVDKKNLFASIWRCLGELLEDINKNKIERIHLSTTICTNAIVECNIAKVGVILQTGPGLNWDYERLGDNVHYISGSTDHRGKVVQDIDKKELELIRKDFLANDVESLAVITKFSTRNPSTEKRIRNFFSDDFSEITLGHSLSGKLSFPRRVQTAYLNAAVADTFKAFALNMRQALAEENISAPVYILKADGGTVDLETALKKPVETILSGPAASFMGMTALFPQDETDAVLLDIGGTTTDIFFLVDGIPLFEPMGIEIDDRKTLVRAVYSVSIGLGGDSEIHIENGKLEIGPKRLGSAIAFGGQSLTPTDALVYLGAMSGKYPEKSKNALAKLALQLNLDPEATARLIVDRFCEIILSNINSLLEKLNQSPVYTIKELLYSEEIDPQTIKLIGGPAKAIAPYLEKASGKKIIYPQNYEIANALGAALAKPTMEISLYANTEQSLLTVPELGIKENIRKSYDLEQAEAFALAQVEKMAEKMGLPPKDTEAEIIEASSFNMVRGFFGRDKNIRVRAQIKPGLLYSLQQQEVQ